MKKTVAPGAKTPLFDRIFKPELITLENGHTVTRPRSRTPLIANYVTDGLRKYGRKSMPMPLLWPITRTTAWKPSC